MKFNAQKCYILRLSPTRKPITGYYTLGNHTLEQVKSNPYLCVLHSEDLKWATHINSIANKANRTQGFLLRNLNSCPKELKELSYFSLVRSTLDYSSIIQDPHFAKNIQTLDKIQRHEAQFVCNKYKWERSVTEMLQ